ncbi:MAG TPA: hypothetical protein VL134_10280 [Leptolyngbya sp.]|jgi:hypothetical protein|nr:hypothetical protein [Leptolyngbya sp.]
MNLLEDFLARHQLVDDSIEIRSIEPSLELIEIGTVQRSTGILVPTRVLVPKRNWYNPQKSFRRFNRVVLPSRNSWRSIQLSRWAEWVLIPLAIGQLWWSAVSVSN